MRNYTLGFLTGILAWNIAILIGEAYKYDREFDLQVRMMHAEAEAIKRLYR